MTFLAEPPPTRPPRAPSRSRPPTISRIPLDRTPFPIDTFGKCRPEVSMAPPRPALPPRRHRSRARRRFARPRLEVLEVRTTPAPIPIVVDTPDDTALPL